MMELSEHMEKTISATKNYLSTIRTSRANPDILSKIQVEYYGSQVPIKQLASISVPENMLLVINVYDKSSVKNVEKAILTSDLNINPQVDGSIIRLRFPDLTEDRRKELVKLVKKQTEEGKIAIRNIRRDHLDKEKTKEKNKEISEDEFKTIQNDIQKMTDKNIHILEEMEKAKESEIMTI
ncbi:ribosome recycling factor [Candidatus Margulisiibacteriota bacterium]